MKLPISWWHDYSLPVGTSQRDALQKFQEDCPGWRGHDYLLATDGSGHQDGAGAYCAVFRPSYDDAEFLYRMGSNYGDTVNRNELRALVEGLHGICKVEAMNRGAGDGHKSWNDLRDSPLRVMWITDRAQLAASLLYDEDDEALVARHADQDLWAQFAFLQRACVISPIHRPRNDHPAQAECDRVCAGLRKKMLEQMEAMDGLPPTITQKSVL